VELQALTATVQSLIAELRQEHGWSLEELAAAINQVGGTASLDGLQRLAAGDSTDVEFQSVVGVCLLAKPSPERLAAFVDARIQDSFAKALSAPESPDARALLMSDLLAGVYSQQGEAVSLEGDPLEQARRTSLGEAVTHRQALRAADVLIDLSAGND
jgi:transcriptional regulator with XRE-family HTH domain